MIVGVRGWINVERGSEASITFLPQAFIVAFELKSRRLGIGAAGKASNFLFAYATRTCDFRPARACRCFVAWSLAMATILAAVLAKHLDLAASLATVSAFKRSIFAVSWSMTQLLTKVQATLQLLTARLAASCFLEMTRLAM